MPSTPNTKKNTKSFFSFLLHRHASTNTTTRKPTIDFIFWAIGMVCDREQEAQNPQKSSQLACQKKFPPGPFKKKISLEPDEPSLASSGKKRKRKKIPIKKKEEKTFAKRQILFVPLVASSRTNQHIHLKANKRLYVLDV